MDKLIGSIVIIIGIIFIMVYDIVLGGGITFIIIGYYIIANDNHDALINRLIKLKQLVESNGKSM